MDKKLLINPKFLEEVKRAALSHKDDAIPYGEPELYSAMMWAKGTVDVLKSRGFKIEKDEK